MQPATTNNPMRLHSMRALRAGWSLIELLVVVAIIAILLAILVNTAAESRGPVEQTKVTLKAMMAIYDEYEVSTNKVPGSTAGSVSQFCIDVRAFERTQKMLAALGKDVAIDNAPATVDGLIDTVRDGWGVDIRYYPGGSGAGMISFKGPYFASAGPDGKWGTINPATNQPTADTAGTEAKDNLYSFSLGD